MLTDETSLGGNIAMKSDKIILEVIVFHVNIIFFPCYKECYRKRACVIVSFNLQLRFHILVKA